MKKNTSFLPRQTKEKGSSSGWKYLALISIGFLVGTFAFLYLPGLEGFKTNLTSNQDLPPLFEKNGITYVAFPHPMIGLTIISSSDCKGKICDLNSAFKELKQMVSPAIAAKVVDKKTKEGEELIKKYKIENLPAFLFDKNVEFAENFLQLQQIISLRDDRYVLTGPVGEKLTSESPAALPSDQKASPQADAKENNELKNEAQNSAAPVKSKE